MDTFRKLRKQLVDSKKAAAAASKATPEEQPKSEPKPKPEKETAATSQASNRPSGASNIAAATSQASSRPSGQASSRPSGVSNVAGNSENKPKNTFPVRRKQIHETVEKGSQPAQPQASGERKCSLPEEKVNELHETFVLFDKNQDGMITKEELGAVLRALGQRPTVSEVQALIHSVDLDQSGTIDFEEFVKIFSTKLAIDPEKELHEVFCIFDENGDGFISPDELYSILHKLGEHITKTEAQKMINEADLNRDGKVDYREFKAILNAR